MPLTELTKTQEFGRLNAGIGVFACDVRVEAEVRFRVLRKRIEPPRLHPREIRRRRNAVMVIYSSQIIDRMT